jgi:hypothetical protein
MVKNPHGTSESSLLTNNAPKERQYTSLAFFLAANQNVVFCRDSIRQLQIARCPPFSISVSIVKAQ